MIFRELTCAEVPLMIPIGEAFFREKVGHLPGKFDPTHFCSSWHSLLTSGVGLVVGAFEGGTLVGVCGGYVVANPLTSDLELLEAFLYLVPEARRGANARTLIREFEVAGRRRNAVRGYLIHLADVLGPSVERLYRRDGYRPLEQVLVKEF